MLTINEQKRDVALRLYPDGPARIRAKGINTEEPSYQLIVGKTLLLVAWSDSALELREFAEREGWHPE